MLAASFGGRQKVLITSIEALRYRCLEHVRQSLGPFHVLVGPNASGKTTFLDTISFLGRLVSAGLESAVTERSRNFEDLLWKRMPGQTMQLAVEAAIPEAKRKMLGNQDFTTVRYEVEVGADSEDPEPRLLHERVLLKRIDSELPNSQLVFPFPLPQTDSILTAKSIKTKFIINKGDKGNDNFYPETGTGYTPTFRLGPRKSALGNLPEDESNYPVSTWLKQLLINGVEQLVLNSGLIRLASPPQHTRGFRADGSNLPWVIADMKRKASEQYSSWLAHVRTALPDIEGIEVRERSDDRHRYLVIRYAGGYEVPSWMASDGTLRMLALTLLPYLQEFSGIYLIEEPENGIHPRAVETVFQSLSSAYNAQILLATHSPVILNIVDAANVLCFAKNEEGATDIIRGDLHPALRNWQHEVALGELFAGGVLG
jgi:predicted ATPase